MTDDRIPEGPWRTGRSWGRTIVIQSGPEPGSHGQDTLIGYAKGPHAKEIAQQAVDAVNYGQSPPDPWWIADGCLIYVGPAALRESRLTTDWVIAMDTPELAQRVVMAANGQVPDA